jgi:hypothetical protein
MNKYYVEFDGFDYSVYKYDRQLAAFASFAEAYKAKQELEEKPTFTCVDLTPLAMRDAKAHYQTMRAQARSLI